VTIRFGPFTLSLDNRQLKRHDAVIHLTPKAFQLLTALVEERPRVLTKSELLERLWPGTFVAEANVSNLIAEIRSALSDRSRKPEWVRTVHGVGYAFSGPAVADDRTPLERPHCWLQCGRRRFPLSIGEHIVGRDPEAGIRLDAGTVSRRHALLVVTTDGVVVTDTASKNGTRRGSERIKSPVTLAHGDVAHVGSVRLTFHVGLSARTTETQVNSQ